MLIVENIDTLKFKMMWNARPPKNNAFSSILKIFVIARCFGFCPFSIPTKGKLKENTICVKKIDWLWFIVSLSIYISFMVFVIVKYKHRDITELSIMEFILNRIALLGDNSIALMCIVMDMINRKMLWKILTTFSEFDDEVKWF